MAIESHHNTDTCMQMVGTLAQFVANFMPLSSTVRGLWKRVTAAIEQYSIIYMHSGEEVETGGPAPPPPPTSNA